MPGSRVLVHREAWVGVAKAFGDDVDRHAVGDQVEFGDRGMVEVDASTGNGDEPMEHKRGRGVWRRSWKRTLVRRGRDLGACVFG